MSNNLPLTVACHGYDRVQALRDGTIRAEGIDLRMIDLPVEEIFWRQLHHFEFDVSEVSLSSYVMGRSRDQLPLIAIPVFPSRYFRHNCIFVNPAKGIKRPEDLKGKRMAVPEYQMTAAVWARGLLQDDYGVHPRDVEWFTGGVSDPGREEKLALELPPDVHVTPIPTHRTLNEMLESGELDAYMGARIPPVANRGDGTLVRLFPDFETVEAEYYRRTHIFPIMHVLAIRQDVYEANPWIAMNLYKAFLAAKNHCLREMDHTSALQYALPWMWPGLERAKALIGPDFWPYGVDQSRPTLEKFVEYSYEQGLSRRRMTVEELFAPNTLDEFKI